MKKKHTKVISLAIVVVMIFSLFASALASGAALF